MTPLSLIAAQKFAGKLTATGGLQQRVADSASAMNVTVPEILASQILLTAASSEIADKSMQLSYPRVCIYSSAVQDTQAEKFRSFSGVVTVAAEIWSSGNLITQVEQWIHFYAEGVTEVLRASVGDWGDGIYYPGAYEVHFQPPKAGALGFFQSAKLTFKLNASLA